MAEQELPMLQEAAKLAGDIASFAEQHPEIIKAALDVGGTLVVVGTIGKVALEVTKGVAEFGLAVGTLKKGNGHW